MRRLLAVLGMGSFVLCVAACGQGAVDSGVAGSHLAQSHGEAISSGICPGPATVQGIDVSSYQGSIDWGAVRASGMAFAIARIGDGSYQDPTFATNWAGIRAAGMIRGAYQFFEPGGDAVAQANQVVAKVGRLGAGDLPVMLDVEVTGGQSAATIVARIHQWVDVVTAGTGKVPFIYTGAYFWDGNVGGSGDFASLPLAIAWYGTNCPGVPNAWASHGWTFHQYASTGRVGGISGDVDLDVFNGGLDQLNAFAGAGSRVAVNPDLFFFDRTSTGTHSTEVHALSAGAGFHDFSIHAGTALEETGSDGSWQFLTGDYNRDGVKDVYVIKKNGGSGQTEVHVLDGASGFQSFSLHVATALGATGSDDAFVFALGDYNRDGIDDLYAISRHGTGTQSTEVHILDGADNFQTWLLHAGTPLEETGTDGSWQFLVGDYDRDGAPDLYALKKTSTGTHSTEVHVLSGASNYQTWLLHTGSGLGETGSDHAWAFGLADFNGDGVADLYCIAKVNTGTHSTEVHVLSGADNFQSWLLHTGSALGETGTDEAWQFGL